MTIGNLGTGITLSSLATEWGQPGTNVKLGDYTSDRSTREESLFVGVQKSTWSDTKLETMPESSGPAVTRTCFKYNHIQPEGGVYFADAITDAPPAPALPASGAGGRHIFSYAGSNAIQGNGPLSWNPNWSTVFDGNLRGPGFAGSDSSNMYQTRDGQGPANNLDMKRFIHPVANQATGGNLAYQSTDGGSPAVEYTNRFGATWDDNSQYNLLNFPILYVTKRTTRIYFGLAPNVDIPFYICTTPNNNGTSLATGVTNNGAVYDTNSQYHSSYTSRTYVILDINTANFPDTNGVTPVFINSGSPNHYFPEHAQEKSTASNYAAVIGTSATPAGRWQSGDKMYYSSLETTYTTNEGGRFNYNNPGTSVPVGEGNTGQDPSTWNMLWCCSNTELRSHSWKYISKLGSEVPTYPAGGLPNSASVPLHADIAAVRTPLAINLIPNSNPASVTKNTRPVWKFSFSGTGGTEYSPAGWVPIGSAPSQVDVGIIKNGATGYGKQTMTAFSPLDAGGSTIYSVNYLYPVVYSSPGGGNGLGIGQAWSTGPYAFVNVRGDGGSSAGGNYVGGSGNYGNNGPDIAAYWVNNNSSSFSWGGTPLPGGNNVAINYSRSGAELTVAITNNTGNDIFWSNVSQMAMFGMSWYNGSGWSYGNQSAGLYGSGHQAQVIDQNVYSQLSIREKDQYSNQFGWNTYCYHTATASASTVATELANNMNNRGGPNSSPAANSQFPPGGNLGDGSGVYTAGSTGNKGYADGSDLYVYKGDPFTMPTNVADTSPVTAWVKSNMTGSWNPNDAGGQGGNISCTLTSKASNHTMLPPPAFNYGASQSNVNGPISNVKFGVRLGDYANCANEGTDGF